MKIASQWPVLQKSFLFSQNLETVFLKVKLLHQNIRQNRKLATPIVISDVNMEDGVIERAHEQAIVAQLEVSESVEVVANPLVSIMTEISTNNCLPSSGQLDSW